MTRHHVEPSTPRPNTPAAGQQAVLFGSLPASSDPPTPEPQPTRHGTVHDPQVIATVVRAADDPGFLVIERSQRVVKADPARPGVVDTASRDEQDAVLQLLDSGHLRTGGTHHVHHHGHEGPARSILVPRPTRDMVTRWSNLRPIPTPRPAPARTAAATPTQTGGRCGPIVVDVIRPGRGLLVCPQFRGELIRQDGRYLVETETGHVIGRASSYRAGAALLARHHGYTPGPIEIDRSEEGDGNGPAPRSARDRHLGR